MTPENFCYWLQGLLEIGNPDQLTKQQIEIIQDRLDLVFNKETPTRKLNLTTFKEHMEKLGKESDNKTNLPYPVDNPYKQLVDNK